MKNQAKQHGFTLIELSVVLVIIGLLVGAIIVGKELIDAARIRSTISQIEEYKAATNTFRLKYSYLPGDIPPTETSSLGFFTFTGSNAGTLGYGDGDWQIYRGPSTAYNSQESLAFWQHLANAGLIKDFTGAPASNPIVSTTGRVTTTVSGTGVGYFLPPARIGRNAYFVVVNNNTYSTFPGAKPGTNNLFTIIIVNSLITTGLTTTSNATFTPDEAYSIDSKMDDGLPYKGAIVVNGTWTATSTAGSCTMGGSSGSDVAAIYNTNSSTNSNNTFACRPVLIW